MEAWMRQTQKVHEMVWDAIIEENVYSWVDYINVSCSALTKCIFMHISWTQSHALQNALHFFLYMVAWWKIPSFSGVCLWFISWFGIWLGMSHFKLVFSGQSKKYLYHIMRMWLCFETPLNIFRVQIVFKSIMYLLECY